MRNRFICIVRLSSSCIFGTWHVGSKSWCVIDIIVSVSSWIDRDVKDEFASFSKRYIVRKILLFQDLVLDQGVKGEWIPANLTHIVLEITPHLKGHGVPPKVR